MITFSPAKISEIPIIQKLAFTIWYDYYPKIISTEQIAYMLDMMYATRVIEQEMQEGFHWELILYNEENIGFLSYHHEKDSQQVKLNKLYLLPQWHGKGFGQLALQHVINKAKQYKAFSVYLTVNKNNIQAIKAYQKAGFVIDHDEKFDIGNGFFMDDYVMKYHLRVK